MAADLHPTDQHTVQTVLATLGEADVRALLTKAGIKPDNPSTDCDPYRIARILSPLVVAHAHRTLGSLLPNLARVSEAPLPTTDLSVRAQNILAQQDIQKVQDLATFTPERLLRFKNAGRKTVAEYAALAIRIHIQSHDPSARASSNGTADSAAVLLPLYDRAGEADQKSPRQLSLIQCFSALGDSEVRTVLKDAGISPLAMVEDSDVHRIARVLSPVVLERSDRPLGLLLPGLALAAESALPTAELSVRARNVLALNDIVTIATFGAYSLDSIKSLGGAGRITITEYAGLAVRLHMQAFPTLPITEAPSITTPPLATALDRLTEVASWACTTYQTATLGDLVALTLDTEALPPDIVAALTEFRRTSLSPCVVSDARVEGCVDALWLALDERERDIFIARQLSIDRPTLEQLGDKHGVGKERVRQIEVHACELLRAELSTSPQAPLRWRLHAFSSAVRNGLPEAAPTLTDALANAFRGITTSPTVQELLLWLAGPYSRSSGWLLRQGCEIPIVPIHDPRFNGDEVLPQAVAAWLHEAGFRSELVETVMAHSDLKLRDGKWLQWGGLMPDKAAAILRVMRRPAETEELAREIAEGISERSVRNALQSDPRFMRVSKRAFGLREWGLEEYSGIAEEIAQRIERAGGAVEIESLVSELVQTFGVAASSVRMYAEAPRFVLSNGMVRFRMDDEKLPPDARVHAVFGLFPETARHRVHLVVAVDDDVERGSGMGIRPAVANALGLKPGERLYFDDGGAGRLLVSWPDSAACGPSLGSTRALANSAGAVSGDSLLITFDLAAHRVCSHRIHPTTADIRILTGLEIAKGQELDTIAASIGCDPIEVRTVLANRGDHQLLKALPIPHADSHLEAAISTLTEILREP
jgi:hypothetical protein